jgi:acetaldehyde dehydrogenase (acetylating)
VSAQARRYQHRTHAPRRFKVTVYVGSAAVEAAGTWTRGRRATLLDPADPPEVEVDELRVDGNDLEPSEISEAEQAAVELAVVESVEEQGNDYAE